MVHTDEQKWHNMLSRIKTEGREIRRRRRRNTLISVTAGVLLLVATLLPALFENYGEPDEPEYMARQSVELEVDMLVNGVLFDQQLGYFYNSNGGEQ